MWNGTCISSILLLAAAPSCSMRQPSALYSAHIYVYTEYSRIHTILTIHIRYRSISIIHIEALAPAGERNTATAGGARIYSSLGIDRSIYELLMRPRPYTPYIL